MLLILLTIDFALDSFFGGFGDGLLARCSGVGNEVGLADGDGSGVGEAAAAATFTLLIAGFGGEEFHQREASATEARTTISAVTKRAAIRFR